MVYSVRIRRGTSDEGPRIVIGLDPSLPMLGEPTVDLSQHDWTIGTEGSNSSRSANESQV